MNWKKEESITKIRKKAKLKRALEFVKAKPPPQVKNILAGGLDAKNVKRSEDKKL